MPSVADDDHVGSPPASGQGELAEAGTDLPPAARRALAEAAARRGEIDARARACADERGGRGGLDPVRYDDWEIDGRAVDF